MFRKALIKLTLLYLLIIMVISLFFTVNIYRISTNEINNNSRRQQMSIERFGPRGLFTNPDLLQEREDILNEARNRILINLIYTNLTIFVLGGALSYYLAGLTLKPIEESHAVQARFASDASHELRSPLAAMKTEIEVALRDNNLTKEEAISLLKSNLEEVERLKMLAEGLLELTRSKQAITKTRLDFAKTIKSATKNMEKIAKERKVKIDFDLDEGVFVLANEESLKELVDILVDNAVKYSEPGKTVRIATSKNTKMGILTIMDEGVGISEEELPKIFERFYRADQSRTKNVANGYGLGLAIAKQIVEANNGMIEANSNLGQGSTFVVKLPLINS